MNLSSVTSMYAMVELFLMGIPVALVVIVVLTYQRVVRRDEGTWTTREVVTVDVPGGYRAPQRRPGVIERLRETPSALKVTALFALIFGIMWMPSLPLVAVGALVELDGSRGKPGLATLFGLPGIALSIAHFVLGLRFTRRGAKSRRLARAVALWSTVHNISLVGFVLFVTFGVTDAPALQLARLDALGAIVVLYAMLSIGFAWFAWRAADIHETIDDSGADVPEVPIAPLEPPTASYGEAPPYP